MQQGLDQIALRAYQCLEKGLYDEAMLHVGMLASKLSKEPEHSKKISSSLTKKQKTFLLSYLDDVVHLNNSLLTHTEQDEFIRAVTHMDFDSNASPEQCKTAMELLAMNLLSECEISPSFGRSKGLYIVFSEKGAQALFELLNPRN